MRAATAAVAALLALSLAACGHGRAAVSASAASQLGRRIDAVRLAALADDPAGATAQLAALRVDVVGLEHAGQLSSGRAAMLLADAAAVEAQLAGLPAPTTTTTTPAPPPPTDHPHHHHPGPGGGGGG